VKLSILAHHLRRKKQKEKEKFTKLHEEKKMYRPSPAIRMFPVGRNQRHKTGRNKVFVA
jgi:hypothetical protein